MLSDQKQLPVQLENKETKIRIVTSKANMEKAARYWEKLCKEQSESYGFIPTESTSIDFRDELKSSGKLLKDMSIAEFVARLVKIKKHINRASFISDGIFCNEIEEEILGAINIVIPEVTVYESGARSDSEKKEAKSVERYTSPISATVFVTNSALLFHKYDRKYERDKEKSLVTKGLEYIKGTRHDMDWVEDKSKWTYKHAGMTVDKKAVAVITDEKSTIDLFIDDKKFYALYEERLLPIFLEANRRAKQENKKGIITIPDMGMDLLIAGIFKATEKMGERYRQVLEKLLTRHGDKLTHIAAVWFDPKDECADKLGSTVIENITFHVMPTSHCGDKARPQLSRPCDFDARYKDHKLFHLVEGHYAGFPFEEWVDSYGSSTDAGACGRATNALKCLGLDGNTGDYSDKDGKRGYRPKGYDSWSELIDNKKLKLNIDVEQIYYYDPEKTQLMQLNYTDPLKNGVSILNAIKQSIEQHDYVLGGFLSGMQCTSNPNKKISTGAYEVYQVVERAISNKNMNYEATMNEIRGKLSGKNIVTSGFFCTGWGARTQSTVDLYNTILDMTRRNRYQ